ncbi:hypothetical protein [Aureibaculum luteum]|uniref:hypothetical protein n=1 Tax=Aureibaculum luteum TaxID=1548456 RepID=UPI001300AB8A|nr:hypothetical protein [Aureibaculum luteum]
MKKYVYLIGIVICFSCASENQQKGLDKVVSHFGGNASFSKSFNSTIGQETIKSFDIKISNSFMLDTLRQDLSTAKIAMLLYDSFSQEEKDDYNQINVELENSSSNKSSIFKYNSKTLINLLDQNEIFIEFSENLKKENYQLISENVKPKYRTETLADGLKQFMKNLTDQHGRLVSYKATEVGVFTAKQEQQYKYKGFLTFEDDYYRNYFITTSKEVDIDYIAGYQLDLY